VKTGKNYTVYHCHTELSLLDSCTNFKAYVDKAKELGQKTIGFSEHGNTLSWVDKKMYCEKQGLKYLHGIEVYLTRTHETKERDNFHTILIAKNLDGVRELNSLIELSSREDHKYYNDRISFDEFFALSGNIIKISACLASPLNKIGEFGEIYERLVKAYDYLEIQPHVNSPDQKVYNEKLHRLFEQYGVPLIAGTDTHSIDKYKAECRAILLKAKRKAYGDEDEFDLTYKSYDELVEMFRQQGVLPESVYLQAIENTNVMADSVKDFELDLSFKYPKLYDNEEAVFWDRIIRMYNEKLTSGAIQDNPKYMENINEEFVVLKKIGMCGFMLFMSELMTWCWLNDIPSSPCRGSVGGSTIAYLTDITDVDPIIWNTVFSRFANEDRVEIGDIDCDYSPEDREKVYKYIVDRFGVESTAYIMATGTCVEKGTIDEICRALEIPLKETDKIKSEYATDPDKARQKYSNVFYYFDGLLNTAISKGVHPAAIIISPITLSDNYGVYNYDGKRVISINMDEVHEVSLVKYDILGLKNVGVIKRCCELAGIPYPRAHTINWTDEAVWSSVVKSNIGIFQYESTFAGDYLRKFEPKRINDLALLNAALRPSGASYRDRLIARETNENPSEIIDEMLSENYGFLAFQEDTISFLKDICGLTGSEADNIRRAIGRKQKDRLDAALPQILEGYCGKTPKERAVAEREAQAFLQIIEDSSNYQFNKAHATGYSLLGYLCAYMRHYYPLEFCTALLAYANSESDTVDATELARLLKININPVKFRYSKAEYAPDKPNDAIYKGIGSIKYCNEGMGEALYALRDKKYDTFTDLLLELKNIAINSRQLEILMRLDFFSPEFGNSKELLRINEVFVQLKQGAAKQIPKDKITDPVMTAIISRHSRETAKKYNLSDVVGCLKELEQYVRSEGLEDFTLQEKAIDQLAYLGYVDLKTGLAEDTNKLMIMSVEPLKTRDKAKTWGYRLRTHSVGRGKQAELTVFSRVFDKNPVQKFDTIFAKKEWVQVKEYNGYKNYYLSNYERVI